MVFAYARQGWKNGEYLAVQWRTETSTGNLSTCYRHVHDMVEKYREEQGFDRNQVFFNTDLQEQTSGTYANKVPRYHDW